MLENLEKENDELRDLNSQLKVFIEHLKTSMTSGEKKEKKRKKIKERNKNLIFLQGQDF